MVIEKEGFVELLYLRLRDYGKCKRLQNFIQKLSIFFLGFA